MKQKVLVSLTVLVMIPFFANSQEPGIGEKMPELTLTNLVNYEFEHLSLSDLRGKLVILDYWATNCIGCIQSFPKLDELQKQFEDRVKILLISKESADSLDRFFAKRKMVHKPNVTFVTSDTVLFNLFKPDGLPYNIWIDSSGKVVCKVYGASTNAVSINKYLRGEPLNLVPYHGRQYIEPLINKKYEPEVKYISYLTNCVPYNKYSYSKEFEERTVRISLRCLPVRELYRRAYNGDRNRFFRNYQFEFLIADSSRYYRPEVLEDPLGWLFRNSYDYTLIIPKKRKQEIYQLMQADLERYFDFDVKIEKKMKKGLVLVKNGIGVVSTSEGKAEDHFFASTEHNPLPDGPRFIKNAPFELFAKRLGALLESKFDQPFKDETAISGNVDITITGNSLDELDLQKLNKELKKYGLEIIEKELEVEVLIVKENDRQL
jgi:thiol-disulfide isomerase/thioredoxin